MWYVLKKKFIKFIKIFFRLLILNITTQKVIGTLLKWNWKKKQVLFAQKSGDAGIRKEWEVKKKRIKGTIKPRGREREGECLKCLDDCICSTSLMVLFNQPDVKPTIVKQQQHQ